MYARIIVPLDGSPFAELVLPAAVALARRLGASLELVRVHTGHALNVRAEPDLAAARLDAREEDEARAYLEGLAVTLGADGPPVVPRLLPHPAPVTAIVEEAAGGPASLLVMTSHGRTGLRRAVLGSVADGVVHHAECPILLWRPAHDEQPAPDRFEQVLVALDGSPFAEAVLTHALLLTAADEARVTLFRVVPPVLEGLEPVALAPFALDAAGTTPVAVVNRPATARALVEAQRYLAELAARLRPRFPRLWMDVRVVEGEQPGQAIILAAAELGADLVALTTHARGISRLVFGSTTDDVLRGRHGATLLVHPARVAD